MGGEKGTSAKTDPALGGVKVQTSVYGTAHQRVYGRTKIAGNLGWYSNFKSEAVFSEAAGKGGGERGSQSGWKYTADVVMFLGHGPITTVSTVWRGREKLTGQEIPIGRRALVYTGTHVAGQSFLVPESTIFSELISVLYYLAPSPTGVEGEYSAAQNRVLVEGVDFTRLGGSFSLVGVTGEVRIEYIVEHLEPSNSALAATGLVLRNGSVSQSPLSQIQGSNPAQALGYVGLAYVYAQGYALGGEGAVENHEFEVDGALSYGGVPDLPDANAADVVADILLNPINGVQFEGALIDSASLANWRAYCIVNRLMVSPAYSSQQDARSVLQKLLEATNTDAFWTGERLRFVPRGDEAMAVHGVTFQPDASVAFDVDANDFLADDGCAPVQVRRKALSERHNRVTIEYLNRTNNYAKEPVIWEDDAAIIRDGVNAEDSQSWEMFCDGQAALQAATLRGQRKQAVTAEYEFSLWWRFLRLQPGQLLRLYDDAAGLDGVIVKVTSVTEAEDDSIQVVAEDFPIGSASASVNPPQLGSGFSANTNAPGGSIAEPAFIEPPGGITETGLEVWIAASGSSELWGGCDIYVSLDGNSYRAVGQIDEGARYGSLASAMGISGSVDVQLVGKGGQIPTVAAIAADANQTMCFVGVPSSGEYFSYETSALTAANAYTLGGLRRAQNDSVAAAHLVGAPFAVIDSALGKSGPLDRTMVGKTLYFKFPSFNVFGGGRESLASVPAYAYTLTGRFMNVAGKPATEGRGANLLDNASFKSSKAGWVSYFSPGASAAGFSWLAPGVQDAPNPYGALRLDFEGPWDCDANVNTGVAPVPVFAGERIEASTYVGVHRGQVSLSIAWLNASGVIFASNVVAGGVSFVDGDTVYPVTKVADYVRLWGFAVAPAGATQAAIAVTAIRKSAGFSTVAWMSLPFLSRASAAQVTPSPWSDGTPRGALALSDSAFKSASMDYSGELAFQGIFSSTVKAQGYFVLDRPAVIQVHLKLTPSWVTNFRDPLPGTAFDKYLDYYANVELEKSGEYIKFIVTARGWVGNYPSLAGGSKLGSKISASGQSDLLPAGAYWFNPSVSVYSAVGFTNTDQFVASEYRLEILANYQ